LRGKLRVIRHDFKADPIVELSVCDQRARLVGGERVTGRDAFGQVNLIQAGNQLKRIADLSAGERRWVRARLEANQDVACFILTWIDGEDLAVGGDGRSDRRRRHPVFQKLATQSRLVIELGGLEMTNSTEPMSGHVGNLKLGARKTTARAPCRDSAHARDV
jgi:hypothetical protein